MTKEPEKCPYYAIGRTGSTLNPWLGMIPTHGGVKECFGKFLEFTIVGGAVKLFATPEDARTHLALQFPEIQDTLKVYCIQEDASGIQMTMQ